VQIYKTRIFARFARKVKLDDPALAGAVADIERGLISADLGGGVIKRRIARPGGGGKSGGFRTIILFRTETRAVFVYGFEKNAKDNIDAAELAAFRRLASQLLARDDGEIETALETGALIEVLE
jgi:hypothetical protein